MNYASPSAIGAFLSDEEERVLSALREMAAEIREGGLRLDVEALGASIRAAGGRPCGADASGGGSLFQLRGTRFLVRLSGDSVEVGFLEGGT